MKDENHPKKKRKRVDETLEEIKKTKNNKIPSPNINMGKSNPSGEKPNILELDINELSEIFGKKNKKTKINKKNKTDKIKTFDKKETLDKTKTLDKKESIKKFGGYYNEDNEFVIPDTFSEETIDDNVIDLENNSPPHKKNKEPTPKELGLTEEEYALFTEEEIEYWKKISKKERELLKKLEKDLEEFDKNEIPERFQLLKAPIDMPNKKNIMNKLLQVDMMEPTDPEYFKLNKWVDGALKIPFGKYSSISINKNDDIETLQNYLDNVNLTMNSSTFGHEEAKDKIMQIVCQWISNPSSSGNILALEGPPGIGKTSLVRNGIAKALGRPFSMIALGGATDSTFLEGHNYTYEGSTWGRIAQILMDSKCMNPVIFFDELDKVSSTKHGEEIIGVLTHLTDQTQNVAFHDKYFSGIDLDLSRCLFVFSYNDEELINPILRDRLLKIKLEGFKTHDKINIARNYLLPELINNIGLKTDDVSISDDCIKHIIEKYTKEEGVRELRRCIETILLKINKAKYIKDENINFPVLLTTQLVELLLKKIDKSIFKNNSAIMMYI